ncbi:SNAP receptor VAM3 KNAG_0H03400 [Huiozyma naganishii CBS 8797]|uniref:t-SNARE coiled-coil homology domain-containing protein n=1 Tax=Huiozyma naganishii (strain ATCC MYA-139 / BCRC 22969 / CBS 8797 / KCTC 17520 / NBRC 10181 / NCYC 3082 / Yp74L-3) TaxID=1071383 RepID=J7S8V0_HUIN7|nr:hypothetical protein KNAG_0H03400 [Kazachstania naganishii CBS 8797]CCK71754.1 hypothetical protein KNAG_0H03400 [Kazachstania naganishii CBS 8797]
MGEDITELLVSLNSNVKVLRRVRRQVERGTKKGEDPNVSEEWASRIHNCEDILGRIQNGVPIPTALRGDYDALVAEFHALENRGLAVDKNSHSDDPQGLLPEATTPLLLKQQQPQLAPQQEVEYQSILQAERHDRVASLQHATTEVNTIFKELFHLVKQQGAQVDSVAQNIDSAAGIAADASRDLRRAAERQRASSRCCSTALIAGCLALLIVLVAVS